MDGLKVGFFSDLHSEFLRPRILLSPKDRRLGRIYAQEDLADALAASYVHCDVIVAAGDIGDGAKAVDFLKMAFPEKPVIFVPGNHEYWGSEMFTVQKKMELGCEGTNIHFMHDGNKTIEIEGVRFCGATLWTDYKLTGSEYAMNEAERLMNDFRKIRVLKGGGGRLGVPGGAYSKVKPGHFAQFHADHLRSIKKEMARALEDDAILVVVSHHAPSSESLVFDSERDHLREWGPVFEAHDVCYASHLDHLFEGDEAPSYWIHGHTHVAVDYRVGNTRVVSNPKGYAEGDETGWRIGRHLEIPT
jgi:Icc-related predicted phosphoesterase